MLNTVEHELNIFAEMCPKPNVNDTSLASKSHVEELAEPQQDLFAILTEEKDHLLRWTTYSMPLKVVVMESIDSHKESAKTEGSDGIDVEKDIAVNCTVAYMSQCMSWNKCKSSCTSMGATSYRWFHDGCCQCVGAYCINYGLNESKCLQCPLTSEQDFIDTNQMSVHEHDTGGPEDRNPDSDDVDSDEEEQQRSHNTLNGDKSEKTLDKQSADKKSAEDKKSTHQ